MNMRVNMTAWLSLTNPVTEFVASTGSATKVGH